MIVKAKPYLLQNGKLILSRFAFKHTVILPSQGELNPID